MSKEVKNIPASVKAKLLNRSRELKRPFQEVLQYYAMERFLYRLSVSPYRDRFTLKGALMFYTWQLDAYRPTVDIDLLGTTNHSVDNIRSIISSICEDEKHEEDGITFSIKNISVIETQLDSEYSGIQAKFQAHLGKIRIPMRIDIGFGDVVTPCPADINYPTLIEMPAPSLLGYTPETVIAEKIQTILAKGLINSRMKDFYDVWMISRQLSFSDKSLGDALRNTFTNRDSENLLGEFSVILESLKEEKALAQRWLQFIKRSRLPVAPPDYPSVITNIKVFVESILGVT